MVQGFGPPTWSINTMDYGFFGEDHWKVNPRLTLDLGIRYDYESLPAPYSNLITPVGNFHAVPGLVEWALLCIHRLPAPAPRLAAHANIANHPSDKKNIGPRIGIAYDPYGAGKTTIRVGYGMYFGRVTNGVLLNDLLNTGSPNGQYRILVVHARLTAGATAFPQPPHGWCLQRAQLVLLRQ